MLNVEQFYKAYGVSPGVNEIIDLCGKEVVCYTQKLFIICKELHQDPFNWLFCEEDSVVFETAAGHLSIMVLFDSEQDETQSAIAVCNRLVGMVH